MAKIKIELYTVFGMSLVLTLGDGQVGIVDGQFGFQQLAAGGDRADGQESHETAAEEQRSEHFVSIAG